MVSKLHRKVLKGRPAMQNPSRPIFQMQHAADNPLPSRCAECIYKALTVTFMLLLLGSL
jgi:hypothetical protein